MKAAPDFGEDGPDSNRRRQRSANADLVLTRCLYERNLPPTQLDLQLDELVGAWLNAATQNDIAPDTVVSIERHTYATESGCLLSTSTSDARNAWRFPECRITGRTSRQVPSRFAPMCLDQRGGCFETILRETRWTGWRGVKNVTFEPVAVADQSDIHVPRLWHLMHRWLTGTEPHWTDRFPPEVDALIRRQGH